MKRSFEYFKELFSNHKIMMTIKSFEKIIQSYNFYLVENYDDINFIQKIDDNIITIDSYKTKTGENYIFMCFGKILIVVSESNLHIFKDFFMKRKNSKISLLKKHLMEYLNKFIDFPLQNSDNDEEYENFEIININSIFLNEIKSFVSQFNIENERANQFWLIIRQSIAGYLIKKGYEKIREIQKIKFEEFYSKHQNFQENKIFDKDDYITLRSLGNGSSSTVNLIYSIIDENLYAMKIIHSYEDENEKEKLLKREIYNYSKISFPFLPKLYGITNIQSNKCFIIDFIDGCSLESMKKLYLSDHEKIKIIYELLITFEYLHLNNFVYRDLKPNNIIISHDCHPFIYDFDRMIDLNDKENIDNFTEVWSSYKSRNFNSGSLSQKTDIYSIGLLIYSIMSENFEIIEFDDNETPKIKLDKRILLKYPMLKDLCEQCIQKDRDKRPNISELINKFYIDYFSKIPYQISEIDTIKNLKYDGIYELFQYRFLISNIKNSNALNNLGYLYQFGHYVNQDYPKAKKYYELSAKLNNSDALNKLGNLYYNGYGVEQDYLKAKEYYELSAKLNNSDALYKLGNLYYNGYGVEQDYLKAKEYYELASKSNNSYDFNYGNLYKKDNQDRLKLNQPNKFAELILEKLYFNGNKELYDKSPQNFDKSFYFLNEGDNCTQKNSNGKDNDKSFEYYEKSAEFNNSFAFLILGNIYLKIKKNANKALEYYQRSADLNNSFAYLFLGDLYCNGDIFDQNYLKAKEYYEKSAQQKNLSSYNNLGLLYEYGLGIEKNYLKAKEYYELSIKNSNTTANFNIGNLYYIENSVKYDYLNAKKYYELSADQNCSAAFFNLANLYYNGLGVKKDILKAIELYNSSAKLNNQFAFYKLGIIYSTDDRIARDYIKARENFIKSAILNNSDALYELGKIYENGVGVKKSYSTAIHYYALSADLKNSDALLKLGDFYFKGIGVEIDYLKAINYYLISSEKQNSKAFYKLGFLYENGYGVQKDYKKAIEYFEKAAKYNNSNALLKLGNFYEIGVDTRVDFQKAKKYYELSAKLNNSYALYKLGVFYEEGYGVVKDNNKAIFLYELSAGQNNSFALLALGNVYEKQSKLDDAIKYFEKSAELNNSYALLKLGNIYLKGINGNKNYEKAKRCFELSAMLQNSDALIKLGEMYENGNGVEKSYVKSISYYELSANLNNPQALFHLGYLYSTYILDDKKAIYYFKKCINFESKTISIHIKSDDFDLYNINFESFYKYLAYNDLGLICLFDSYNISKSNELIKFSAFAEYPFGQNNFGLINLFYMIKIEEAEYMFKRASRCNFALAECNLGFLYEKDNDISKSIECFIKASEHEDEPLIYRGKMIYDKRLEISKTFIICLINLKLSVYFMGLKNKEAKKYFIKSFAKLNNSSYKFIFRFEYKENGLFSYLANYILNFPLFNLLEQPNLNNQSKIILNNLKEQNYSNETNSNAVSRQCCYQFLYQNEIGFNDPAELFDYVKNSIHLKNGFIEEIKRIIKFMEDIIYTYPYNIFFGRIYIQQTILKQSSQLKYFQKDIDSSFYEGFGIRS